MQETSPDRVMERVESECGECGNTYEHDIPVQMTDPTATLRQVKMRESIRALAMKRELCHPCAKAKRQEWDREDALDAQRRLLTVQRGRLVSSGLDPKVLERIDPSWTWSPAAVGAVKAWEVDAGRPGGDVPPGLLLYGAKGRGKTLLAAQAFHGILKRYPGFWRQTTKLIEEAWSDFDSPERAESRILAQGHHVVCLDDLDKPRSTEATRERLFDVVDALYSRGTPFLATMNLTPDQFAHRFGEAGATIVSRLQEAAQFVAFQGPDLRAAQARRVLAA